MGSGTYSIANSVSRAETKEYFTKSANEIFTQRSINNAMSPHGVKIRESRDSEEHPNSLAIILGLDVTGSMGSIPHHLVKKGLTEIMDDILKAGVKDPQVLFTAVGDHECDSAPLQVGQFESSDELLDHWLTNVFIESGGGGNDGESYLLAWYFAHYHTSIDCAEKRGQKGFLFTIGDEKTLMGVPKSTLTGIMGDSQYDDFSAAELLDKAKEKYNVFHIHVREGSNGTREDVMADWKQLMGDNFIIAEKKEDIPGLISSTILEIMNGPQNINKPEIPNDPEEKVML